MTPEQLPPLRGRATITTVLFVVIFIALCLVLWMYRNTPPFSDFFGTNTATTTPAQEQETGGIKVTYRCDAGKTFAAEYILGQSSTTTSQGTPPISRGAVELTFADGTMMRLPQTISASGIRYANTDESLIFWSKGNTAFIMQGIGSSQTQTYSNCVEQGQ